MSESVPPGGRPAGMPKADFVTGLVLALLGLAVLWASLEMPRFEARGLTARNLAAFRDGELNALLGIDGRERAVVHLTLVGRGD